MGAFLQEGVKVEGKGGREGLAFTGLHFSNSPLVEYDTTDQLNIEMSHAQDPDRSLPNGRKGLRKQVIQGFTLGKLFLEFGGL